MAPVVIIEGLVILLLAVLVAGLLKSHAEILRQLDALGVDEDGALRPGVGQTTPRTSGLEKAPMTTLSGSDPSGGEVSLSLEHGQGTTLLAFLSSGCLSCETFWEEFSRDFDLPSPDTRTVIVTKGPSSESPSRIGQLAPAGIPLVMSDQIWDRFRVPMTPYFLYVDGTGSILGEGAAANWKHLIGLLRQSAQDSAGAGSSSRSVTGDEHLHRAGVEPGDESLYRNPVDST
jgi:hypothetical protein